jgi:hypothetical protein
LTEISSMLKNLDNLLMPQLEHGVFGMLLAIASVICFVFCSVCVCVCVCVCVLRFLLLRCRNLLSRMLPYKCKKRRRRPQQQRHYRNFLRRWWRQRAISPIAVLPQHARCSVEG